jgi:hypothetical protein
MYSIFDGVYLSHAFSNLEIIPIKARSVCDLCMLREDLNGIKKRVILFTVLQD